MTVYTNKGKVLRQLCCLRKIFLLPGMLYGNVASDRSLIIVPQRILRNP